MAKKAKRKSSLMKRIKRKWKKNLSKTIRREITKVISFFFPTLLFTFLLFAFCSVLVGLFVDFHSFRIFDGGLGQGLTCDEPKSKMMEFSSYLSATDCPTGWLVVGCLCVCEGRRRVWEDRGVLLVWTMGHVHSTNRTYPQSRMVLSCSIDELY